MGQRLITSQRQDLENRLTRAEQLLRELQENRQNAINNPGQLQREAKVNDLRIEAYQSQLSETGQELTERINDLESQLSNIQEQLQGKDRQIADLESTLSNVQEQSQGKDRKNADKQSNLTNLQEQSQGKDQIIAAKQSNLTNLQVQSQEKDQKIADLQSQLTNYNLPEQSQEKDRQIADMRSNLSKLQENLQEKDQQIAHLQNLQEQSKEKDRQIAEMKSNFTNLQEQSQGKDQQIADLQRQLSNLQEQSKEKNLQKQSKEKGRQIAEMKSNLANLQEQSLGKDQQIADLQSKLTNLQKQSKEKDRQIADLRSNSTNLQEQSEEKDRQLSDLQSSWEIKRDEIQLAEELGKGEWGRVVQGTFRRCKFAVKEICGNFQTPEKRALFEQQVRMASRYRHPCLLQFIGATNDDQGLLLVMELMDCSLRSLYKAQELTQNEVYVISLDVAQALNYLHQNKPDPIIHRDISSVNVLLWRQGDQWRGKLSHYRTAHFLRQCTKDDLGTAIYCAPEAVGQDRIISDKTDVYSFGVLICEMCIRKLPDPQTQYEQCELVTNWRLLSHLIWPCVRSRPEWRPDMEKVIDELEHLLLGAMNTERPPSCHYQETCSRFVSSLELAGDFFDAKYDMCYCTECHEARGDDPCYDRGEPPKPYGIPIGWCRFGLKAPSQASAQQVFKNWHVAFHGTRRSSVNSILKCGYLLLPGDVTLGGKELRVEKGHFNEKEKPDRFDIKQIFVSPSVQYAGDDCYAKPSSFEDPTTKKTFAAKTVFQLCICIEPDSYQVGAQTIGATTEIDPHFSNEDLEWSTKERGAIILYGLLVKLDDD